MKWVLKLVAGFALLGASFSASANTWATGVEIEVLKISGGGTFIVFPVGGPVMGCARFRFRQGSLNLSADGQRYQYAMALSAFMLGKRVNIFFDVNSPECFSGKLEIDQLEQS